MCMCVCVCVQVKVKKRYYTLISLSFEDILKIWYNHVNVIRQIDVLK